MAVATGCILFVASLIAAYKSIGLDVSSDELKAARADLKKAGFYATAEELKVGPYQSTEDAETELKQIDKLQDSTIDPYAEMIRDAYGGYGFDSEAARLVIDRYPQILSLAAAAAQKPRLNLNLQWVPPDERGEYELDFSYETAGRVLIIKGLNDGFNGDVREAVHNFALAEDLAALGVDQCSLEYRRVPAMIYGLVDAAVCYLAKKYSEDPIKLNTLLVFAERPRKGGDMMKIVGATAIETMERYFLNNGSRKGLADQIDPSTARFAREKLAINLALREARWALDVKSRLGKETSYEAWTKALRESREKFSKHSGFEGATFIQRKAEMYFPVIDADVVKVTRRVDSKRNSAAYIRVLLYHKANHKWPLNLKETGVVDQTRLGFTTISDGFMIWTEDPAKSRPKVKPTGSPEHDLPRNADLVRHYRPRPG